MSAANAYNWSLIGKIEYLGFPNCIEISNGDAKLIISTDFGPRILFYALDAGENILGWHGEAEVKTELGLWKPYGGHRLWIAPENMPRSYAPDNAGVKYSMETEFSVRFIQRQTPISLIRGGSLKRNPSACVWTKVINRPRRSAY